MEAATAAPVIVADGLARSFGGVDVVRDASLAVHAGEITALVGPNGSGKTTLLLMLATLLAPDRGTVRIAGHDAASDPASARAALGWMPDALGSWPTLTVRETLVAVCGMYGIRGAAAEGRVAELLALADLDGLAAQQTRTLSRGQKQRLSLARAVAHGPRALLLDEPAAGLDPAARLAQRDLLRRLASEGTAILVTSHVLDELDELASNVVFLHDGSTSPTAVVEAALRPGRSWRIRALDAGALHAALAQLGVTAETRQTLAGTSLTVELADEPAAAELLSRLVTLGVPVIGFGPASSAIEQAFVHLSAEEA
ncbi:ATP-binding cassette domain-containing protein [Leucobacter sp. gxy201]|uniref:ABC transporter ATP-binding protein n=1 Tax=Leucobacter sp. gxy201 TaxID=2957200 RepID=UPI003DA162B4